MPWCVVAGNPKRDRGRYGSGGRMTYVDPELGRREYTGVAVRGYDLFLVEVSDTELARIAASQPQGRGGRKYGGLDHNGPWYVSYSPAVAWPDTNVRPWLRPALNSRATPVPLDPGTVQDVEATLDGDGTVDDAVAPAAPVASEPIAPVDGALEALCLAITRCRVCRAEYPETLSEEWMPPRGWAGSLTRRGPLPVMLVSLNPGRRLTRSVSDGGRPGSARRNRARPTRHASFWACRVDTTTRGRLLFTRSASPSHAPACISLTLRQHSRDWQRYAWMTDLYKCSTATEVGPSIPTRALLRCAFSTSEGFLRREISLLAPRVIVALGGRSQRRLLGDREARERVAPFRHPSGASWRLDSQNHDEAFGRVATILDVNIPDGFREARRRYWEEAFA